MKTRFGNQPVMAVLSWRRVSRTLCGVGLCAAAVSGLYADTFTYTFDSPNFSDGAMTPLLNVAPNSGSGSFLASFISSPTANGFTVRSFMPNSLFAGQMLYDPVTPADVLTLSFNQPVDSFRVDFAVISPGRLTLTTPAGTASKNSALVGGTFQGGTLAFDSLIPFTSASLAAFDSSGAQILFAIDNMGLEATPVPEPTSLALFIIAATGLIIWRRRSAGARTDRASS